MQNLENTLTHGPLGKETIYPTQYQPALLFVIPRFLNRQTLGISSEKALAFHGADIWNAYEVSWLNRKGKPQIAFAEFIFPCNTPKLVESKSFKLYLNSFNNTVFDSHEVVKQTLITDLTKATGGPVAVKLLSQLSNNTLHQMEGICLDDLDVSCDRYTPYPRYIQTENEEVQNETLYSDLLKSNCPITSQPDWASIQVTYTGKKIHRENLLKYIVSLRNHDEFHEHCVERIFTDILTRSHPEKLCVYARYTRRGGLDINPYRANYPVELDNIRHLRQ